MEEQTPNKKWLVYVIIGIVVIIAGFVIWYGADTNWTFSKSDSTETADTTPTPTATVTTTPTSVVSSSTSATPTSSATTDPTAGWKTYTNSTYSFSIKYPSEYSAKLEQSEDGIGYAIVNVTFTGSSAEYTVTVAESQGTLMPNGMDPVSTTDFTIGGVLGKNFDDIAYGVSHENYVYRVILNSTTPEVSNLRNASAAIKDTLQYMVESFQFTK